MKQQTKQLNDEREDKVISKVLEREDKVISKVLERAEKVNSEE